MAVPRHLVPLNVKTYRQGFLKLQGWALFSLLAFISGGLLCTYELLVINWEDQDFRDMLFDYRITRPGISVQHKRFANAHFCCHQDSAVFNFTCRPDERFATTFGTGLPRCPPTIEFTCPSLTSRACNRLRAILYPAAGLSVTGEPSNCSRAGQVLLRAQTGHGFRLRLATDNTTTQQQQQQQPQGQQPQQHQLQPEQPEQQLALPRDTTQIDPQQVREFVTAVIEKHSDRLFRLPRVPLGRSLAFEGKQAPLVPQLTAATGDKWGQFGWPWELWPWPPSATCSNTGTPARLHLAGNVRAKFKPFNTSSPPMFNLSIWQDSLTVPQYQVLRLQPGDGRGSSSSQGSSSQEEQVVVSALTSLDLSVGLLPQLGGCEAWQLHHPGLAAGYDLEIWAGSAGQLAALMAASSSMPAAAAGITAGTQVLVLALHDVAEPLALALPHYSGELSLYVALVLGGVWMFSAVPLVIMFGVVFINVQRNKGLPIFLYKYMQKYRGW